MVWHFLSILFLNVSPNIYEPHLTPVCMGSLKIWTIVGIVTFLAEYMLCYVIENDRVSNAFSYLNNVHLEAIKSYFKGPYAEVSIHNFHMK